MGTGYTRQSASSMIDGQVIFANDHNAEFNLLESAFSGVSGHAHDGTLGEGPPISLVNAVIGTLSVQNGGTGGTTPEESRTNLGLGTLSTKNGPSVSVDNSIVRFDGVTGNMQSSLINIDDLGNLVLNSRNISGLADATLDHQGTTLKQLNLVKTDLTTMIDDVRPHIGDYYRTVRTLGSKWLRRDGSVYASSAYPDLAPYMTPVDGSAIFTPLVSNVTFPINGFAHGNGRWVGVGAGTSGVRTVMSTDKVTWTGIDPLFSDYLNSLTFGNSLFASSLYDGNVGTTSSALPGTWTLHAAGGSNGLFTDLAFGNGTWILVTSPIASLGTVVRRSTDLTTWTTVTPADLTANRRIVVFGNNIFLLGGVGNQVHVSNDGITWTPHSVFGAPELTRFSFANGFFWASDSSNNLYRSSDGSTWEQITTGSVSVINSVSYGAGTYVAVCENGNVFASSNGLSWAKQNSPFTTALKRVLFDSADNTFLTAGNGGVIASIEFESSPLFRVPNDDPTLGWIRALE